MRFSVISVSVLAALAQLVSAAPTLDRRASATEKPTIGYAAQGGWVHLVVCVRLFPDWCNLGPRVVLVDLRLPSLRSLHSPLPLPMTRQRLSTFPALSPATPSSRLVPIPPYSASPAHPSSVSAFASTRRTTSSSATSRSQRSLPAPVMLSASRRLPRSGSTT
jgi:hypothetical protein